MRSTKAEIEAFKESLIWQDILDELDEQIEFYKSQLLNIPHNTINNDYSTTSVMANMGCMHGTIRSLTMMRENMLDVLIDKYIAEREQQQNLPQEIDNDE